MRTCDEVKCRTFPCTDVRTESYQVPGVEVQPGSISILLISEAAPPVPSDGYYTGPGSLFERTTLQAFQDAGARFDSLQELLAAGVYLTTAVKCGKTGYGLAGRTVETCSHLLEQELALFPHVQVYLLMGEVAIRAFNLCARRAGGGRVIPAGSTYKLRGQPYFFQGRRVFPSYLQAGPSFFIERSKRRMIAEDLAAALALVHKG